ncbi:Cob(I)yrinic acid a,c-diamide adenosyltransferase [Paenibacillus cisolokensis]|uniref:Corrinoid adenosyltransferase n=1 Tax=Paenibacillus cisolokensis TaxID=1658519 RepID=A0ABQ4NC44_9BACL|nr:cob(I)yrinic acid a,c-diamide adenosyltransferase [Paenibacillus cisolokensis]GIQ65787.1 Cob(I)yrinic acid a,c-diamide adenosyltransferase [Paenibacillus cisolokensis]
MKIYTRAGDEGKTSLIGGRVAKDDLRVEAYGTIDELNAFVGLAAAAAADKLPELAQQLTDIQHELFDCGSDLAYANKDGVSCKMSSAAVDKLEGWIDQYTDEAPELVRFILPGGSDVSALLHVCRTVCRRAERRVVTMMAAHPSNPEVRRYLNRLSDYFFAAARAANARLGFPDVEYARSAEVFRKRKP